jgi:hypothetical protein
MTMKGVPAKILSILGCALVWLPILLPAVFSAARFLRTGAFAFDFLIPVEIFPVPMLGGLLLAGVAYWTRLRRKIIGWALVACLALPLIGQGLAVVTGLASGEVEIGSWQGTLVISVFGFFWAALLALGVAGVLLTCDLFKTKPEL